MFDQIVERSIIANLGTRYHFVAAERCQLHRDRDHCRIGAGLNPDSMQRESKRQNGAAIISARSSLSLCTGICGPMTPLCISFQRPHCLWQPLTNLPGDTRPEQKGKRTREPNAMDDLRTTIHL